MLEVLGRLHGVTREQWEAIGERDRICNVEDDVGPANCCCVKVQDGGFVPR
jgi:hypothetical protein